MKLKSMGGFKQPEWSPCTLNLQLLPFAATLRISDLARRPPGDHQRPRGPQARLLRPAGRQGRQEGQRLQRVLQARAGEARARDQCKSLTSNCHFQRHLWGSG